MASPPPSKRRRKSQSKDEADVPSAAPSSTPEKLSPVVVFAHGAGAPSSSDWMIRWKDMLGKALNAVEVVTFDYPYISGGKKRAPPKAEKLVDFHADVVKKAVAKYPGHPLILAGKSMGSRVSCMVACKEDIHASTIVCLGYPLKGMNGAVRDETILELSIPIMFVQGSKDGLCPLEKLETTRKKIKCLSDLHVIDGGDHSFKIGKKHLQTTGLSQDKAEDLALQAIAAFWLRSLEGSPSMASHTMRCLVVTATVSVATDCHGFEPQSKDSGRWLGHGQIVGHGRMLDHTTDQVWPDWYQGSMTAGFGYSTEPVA
ncbi:hypothetical protein ACFXTI_014596 [Malus domestica]